MKRFFRFEELKTDYRTEAIAGVTTFMTMAYIIFVNPAILSDAHGARMSFDGVMVATCLASAATTLIMAFAANYPIALAPGMGMNAFVSFNICAVMGVPWEIAIGIVFLSGVLFVALTFGGIREKVIEAVPDCLKFSTAAGIGLFIAFIGLQHCGLVVGDPITLVKLGDFRHGPTLLAISGLLFSAGLMARKVKGAILWGILATGVVAVIVGMVKLEGFVSMPPLPTEVFFKLDILGALDVKYIEPIIVLLFFAFFDTVGTLMGVGEHAGLLVDGKLPRVRQAMLADSIGTVIGALLGTSTVTAYIESSAGVSEGGRTGFANLITASLFLLALFFAPLIRVVGGGVEGLYPITGPALIIVGTLMMSSSSKVNWNEFDEALPAFLVMLTMPLTFSISHGLAVGFMSYPIIKLIKGKGREVNPLMYGLALAFILRYALIREGV